MIVQSWDVFDLPTDALVEQLNLLRIMETKNGGTLGQSHSEIRTLIHQELQDRNYTVGILQRQVVPPPPIPPPPPPPVHGVFPTIQPQPQQQQQQPILQQSSSSWSFEQYSGHPGRVSISKPPRQRNPTTAGEGAFVVKKKSSTASAKPKPVEKKRKPPVPRLSRRHQQPTPSSQQGGTTPALSNTNTTEGGGGNDDSATDSDTASSCNSSSDGYAEEEEVTAAPSPMTDEDPLHVNIARSCNDLLSMVVQPSTRTPRLVVLDPPTLPPQPPGGGGGTTNPNSSTSSSRVTTPRPTPRPVGTPPTQAQANSVVVVGPSVVTTTNTATTTVVNSNNTNNTNSSNGAGGAVVENKTESSHKGVAVSIPLVSPSSATSLREKVLSARLSSGGDTITTDNSSIVDVPQPPTTRRSSVGSVSTTASSSITSSVGPFTPYRKPPTPTSAGAPTTTTSTTGSTTNGIVNFTTPRTHNVAPTPPVLPTANKSFACMSVVKEDQGIISLIQKPTSPPQLQPIISSSTTATPQIAPPQQRRNSLTLSDSGGNISSLLHSSNPSSTSNQGGNRSKSAAGATTNNNNTNTINNNNNNNTTTPSSKTTLCNPSPILRKTISAPSVKSSNPQQQQQPSRTSSVRKPSVTVVSSSSDSDGETEDATSKVLTPQSSQPAQLDYTQYFSDFTDLFVAVVPPKGQKVDKYLREREILLEIKQLIAEWVKNPNDTRLGDDSDDDGVTAASRRPMLATTRIDPKDLEGVDGAEMTYRVQRSREEVYDLLTFVCRKITHPSTWQETGDCLFNLHWTWSKPKVTQKFYFIAQLVNHIPGSHVLTRKDCLKKQLYKFRRLPGKTGEFFDICPQSFVLPSEFMALTEAMSTAGSDSYWIAKPVGMSRGRGIQLLTEIGQINYTDNIVVQKYLHNPLLLNGKKFDLRLYVVVTQFGPLEAFISTLGFARFAALPFTLDKASLSNKYIHLTNTAIAKEHHNTSIANGVHKWDLHSLQRHLLSQGVKWDDVWGKIKDVVIKTLVCAEDDVQPLPSPKNTFELFGFDVILDSNYRPWVLEVNASPSMDMDNALDHSVKPQLIMDIIELLDPVPFDRVAMLQVVERRFEENMNTNPYRTHGGPTVKAKQAALNKDLHKILRGRVPFRGYGVPPEDMGHFEMIAPSPSYTKISKMKRM
eukprot:PhF_6_TR25524/c0_g1_i3/m.35711